MAEFRGYFGIENLALNDVQRQALIDGLLTLGKDDNSPNPARRMQFNPIRLDNQAAIFEAAFDNADLTLANLKQRLATLFGVAIGTITSSVTTGAFGRGTTQVVTLGRAGTDYIRVAAFGGTSASYEASRQEVIAYLVVNRAAWGF